MKKIVFSIVATCLFLFHIHAQTNKNSFQEAVKQGYQIGDKINDFSLPNTEGEMISLSSYKNAKGYIIVFSSNVCPYVVASEQRIVQAHKEMAPKGYPVIAINSNVGDEESLLSMKKRTSEQGFPFDYLKDESSVFQKFGATKTPQFFVVDKDMVLRYMGSMDDSPRSAEDVTENYLAKAVKSLSENRLPDPAVTKSIGCSIKRGGDHAGNQRKGPPSPKAMLERFDQNGDQKLSKSETKGPIANDFDKLDTNEDGFLTADELSKAKPPKRKKKQ